MSFSGFPSTPLSYPDWLAQLESLNPHHIELGLTRAQAVERALALRPPAPVVITVAGTNGKGSSAALLATIYQRAGYRTALYTSPHLRDFNERGRINGQPISEAVLVTAFEQVATACQAAHTSLTYFEFTTLAFLWAFSQQTLEVAILEVGLGGRLDAVNLVTPDLALITPIGLDHQAYLGDTREAIGSEKAGIFRAHTPVVCSDPHPPLSVIERAQHLAAPLYRLGQQFGFDRPNEPQGNAGAQWRYHGIHGHKSSYAYPALRGGHQLQNASGVLAALEVLAARLPVSQQAIREGLAMVVWPGRFQQLAGTPSTILDVAHNPHAVATLAHNLQSLPFAPHTHAVFGAMADKDIDQMLDQLAPQIDHWHVCDLPTPRAAKGEEIAQKLRAKNRPVTVYPSVLEAYTAARHLATSADRILVFGSFFTVGPLLPLE